MAVGIIMGAMAEILIQGGNMVVNGKLWIAKFTFIQVTILALFSQDDIFMNFTKTVAFHENIIVNSCASIATLELANKFLKIKSRKFTKITICEISRQKS